MIEWVGGQCGDCGEIGFPQGMSCQRCGGTAMSATPLAREGVLWSWTVQRFPPPSPPYVGTGSDFEPFGVGYVELPGQVIVETRLIEMDAERLRIGMPMRLTEIELSGEGGGVQSIFAFEPMEGA